MKQETIYQVICDGHIHTIIPAENDVPAGWKTTGRSGTKDLCLEYIDEGNEKFNHFFFEEQR